MIARDTQLQSLKRIATSLYEKSNTVLTMEQAQKVVPDITQAEYEEIIAQ